MNEQQSAEQYLTLIEMLQNAGFDHYETSNFAKPGCYSKHNTNYWKGVSYLWIGPSAHSFNGESRQWNIANNAKYIDGILKGIIPAEHEILSIENRVNEYIMTSLRTMWGMDLNTIAIEFGQDYKKHLENNLQEFIEAEHISLNENIATLTNKGKLFADKIASELFITEL